MVGVVGVVGAAVGDGGVGVGVDAGAGVFRGILVVAAVLRGRRHPVSSLAHVCGSQSTFRAKV